MSARLRAVDTFARTGGDEFVIILGELANKNSALMVARSVLDSINKPIEVDDYYLRHLGIDRHLDLSR